MMPYAQGFGKPEHARAILKRIRAASEKVGPINIMEVCGTHTNAIARHGIKSLLPDTIHLISGPGCPVCVTSQHDIDVSLHLADKGEAVFCTFGDMLKVPGTKSNSLEKIKAKGRDIRVVVSPIDCLKIATENKGKPVVFLAIGFETTSPTVAFTVNIAKERKISNFFVFSVHKLISPAMKVLLDDPEINVDAFLLPGHVCTILGKNDFDFLADHGKAGVITGFEAMDILTGILMILRQIEEKNFKIEIEYKRAVREEGNVKAKKILREVFDVSDATWRGLGEIKGSGLKLNDAFFMFDAEKVFDIPEIESEEIKDCICGDILKGKKLPLDCKLFNKGCHPFNPIGPCMVSSEGTCGTFYRYQR